MVSRAGDGEEGSSQPQPAASAHVGSSMRQDTLCIAHSVLQTKPYNSTGAAPSQMHVPAGREQQEAQSCAFPPFHFFPTARKTHESGTWPSQRAVRSLCRSTARNLGLFLE